MNRRLLLLLFLFAAAACRRAPEPPLAPPKTNEEPASIAAPSAEVDRENLLNIPYGASVVSRTGELNLETSAVHAIDGMIFTNWSSPPAGAAQTLVFALGSPSRIEQLGVTTTIKGQSPEQVRFSASSDSRTWREITILQPDSGTKIEPVKPFDARYLRVETIEPKKYYAALASVHALGRELRPPEPHSFGGCWTVNTRRAFLVQRGGRITGVIEGTKQPTYVDGGIEGRVAKLTWMRGPMWGYAVATLTPDARGISAITFHEIPIVINVGEAWIGRRCDDTTVPRTLGPADYIRRTGRWMMSGIVFDGEDRVIEEPSRETLDAAAALIKATPAQRFRVFAQEVHHNDPNENRRRTVARVEAIRAALRARGVDVSRMEFVGNGSKAAVHEMPSAVQRMLWTRVDLELMR